jgi:hypothetical protein
MGLGSLDQLPLELLHETLFYLDMHSLFSFRQTSLRSRQTVDSIKQYQMVVSHGLNLFCALLRTRVANPFKLGSDAVSNAFGVLWKPKYKLLPPYESDST